MKWLVTGAAGMLGRDLVRVLSERCDIELTAASRADLDITDPDAVNAAVTGHDLVVNAAAWTDVDTAEAQPDEALRVNAVAVSHLARACAVSGARLIQISTDYVFAGDASRPYGEAAKPNPINGYGRSKLAGERAVLAELPEAGYIVRTSWLYGDHGGNFVATMLRLAASRPTVEVVTDQHGQPTWTRALADQLRRLGQAALAGTAGPGVYHGTSAGETTWHGLASVTYELAGLDPTRIRPTTSAAFSRPAARPAYSVLGHEGWRRAGIPPQPDWRVQLEQALHEPGLAALAKAARP